MDRVSLLDRRYRALLVREGELLDRMLELLSIGGAEDPSYTALKDELLAIGRLQGRLARALGGGKSGLAAGNEVH